MARFRNSPSAYAARTEVSEKKRHIGIIISFCVCVRGRAAWCQQRQVRLLQGKKKKMPLEKSMCGMEVSVGPVCWGMSGFLLSIARRREKKNYVIRRVSLAPLGAWILTRRLVKTAAIFIAEVLFMYFFLLTEVLLNVMKFRSRDSRIAHPWSTVNHVHAVDENSGMLKMGDTCLWGCRHYFYNHYSKNRNCIASCLGNF